MTQSKQSKIPYHSQLFSSAAAIVNGSDNFTESFRQSLTKRILICELTVNHGITFKGAAKKRFYLVTDNPLIQR